MFLWIVIVGGIASFYNSWGVGCNDCANSFATSVGSKTLTLRQAVICAAIFEFTGAFLMGSHVTSAIRKNIVDLDIFEVDPYVLMLGMLTANISAGIWLHVATYIKMPVSTTHSIIGSIIGFALAYGGKKGVNVDGVIKIVVSWVASPLISGFISLIVYTILKYYVFSRSNPLDRLTVVFPVLIFITFLISSFFIVYKGTPQLDLENTSLVESSIVSVVVSVVAAFIGRLIYVPYAKRHMKIDEEVPEAEPAFQETVIDTPAEMIKNYQTKIEELKKKEKADNIEELYSTANVHDAKCEKLCTPLQVVTACFSSFAHGANDVANSIAPFCTIYSIYLNDEIVKKSDVPLWVLFMGGIGIVLGLSTWGYKVIDRVGKELTKITPSRGFIIELSAALTTLIASRIELPVSTTHCQIGAVVGVGISDRRNNVRWKLVRQIVLSWIVTLPVCGLISAGLFSFAYYSP